MTDDTLDPYSIPPFQAPTGGIANSTRTPHPRPGVPAPSDARQKALDELRAIGARVKAKRDADPESPFAAQWFQIAALIGQIEAQVVAASPEGSRNE